MTNPEPHLFDAGADPGYPARYIADMEKLGASHEFSTASYMGTGAEPTTDGTTPEES